VILWQKVSLDVCLVNAGAAYISEAVLKMLFPPPPTEPVKVRGPVCEVSVDEGSRLKSFCSLFLLSSELSSSTVKVVFVPMSHWFEPMASCKRKAGRWLLSSLTSVHRPNEAQNPLL
jgi:hypothetical protein